MDMPKIAFVAALEREVSGFVRSFNRVERTHAGRQFTFFERDNLVVVCGGIGIESARRASEAVIQLYRPSQLHSLGFAGALNDALHVGDILTPTIVVSARAGSRVTIQGGQG